MLVPTLGILRDKLLSYKNKAVEKVERIAEFKRYLKSNPRKQYEFYRNLSDKKRTETINLLDSIGLDVTGNKILDIGPGCGDSLDVMHERGAAACEYIEIDPYFYTHNRLKPYASGRLMNHLVDLPGLAGRAYDLVWSKGSIGADYFVRLDRNPLRG